MNVSEQLIKAAKNGNSKEVRKLLSKGALFTKDEFGNTALHEAAWTGNNEIVKLLLKAGCFVDSVNGAGFTPLHLACQNGHAKVAKTLLKWKANASIKNQHEENPIHLIAKYDHSHLVPVFAAAKVDLDTKAKDGNTALHIAAKLGYISTVKSLIEHGANPNYSNMKSKLPIDYAEIGDYHDTVKILIPLTNKRPVTNGRRATMDVDSSRSRTPDVSQTNKKSFFGRSPKYAKIDKKKSDSPHLLYDGGFRMRQRSCSNITPPANKRYSREFEDLPPRLYSYSSPGGSSPMVRIERSTTRSPSIDDVMEEESNGSNYKCVPPQSSDESEDNSSITYRPLHRLNLPIKRINSTSSDCPKTNKPPALSINMSLPNLAAGGGRASSHSPKVSSPNAPIYDYLAPRGAKSQWEKTRNSASSSVVPADDSYVCFRPSPDTPNSETRTSPDGQDNPTYSHPVLSDEIIRHHYEYLPPLKGSEEKDDSYDSYIYMAPRSDGPLVVAPPPSGSPSNPSKPSSDVAPVKCSSPEKSKKFAKPILSQVSESNEKRNSQLEKYLEEELETMRQAFHIRLSQIEKKYQRKIASMSTASAGGRSKTNSLIEEDNSRRASWHAGEFGLTDNKDNLEREDETLEEVHDMNGFDKPKLSDFTDDNEEGEVPHETKRLIQERVEDYKSKMMEFFMQQAESQMASLELKYEEKLRSLQNQSSKKTETFV